MPADYFHAPIDREEKVAETRGLENPERADYESDTGKIAQNPRQIENDPAKRRALSLTSQDVRVQIPLSQAGSRKMTLKSREKFVTISFSKTLFLGPPGGPGKTHPDTAQLNTVDPRNGLNNTAYKGANKPKPPRITSTRRMGISPE